jgi:hypothetical protein
LVGSLVVGLVLEVVLGDPKFVLDVPLLKPP